MPSKTILVVSDIHYAGPSEQARPDYELRRIQNPLGRFALRNYRRHIWLRDPLQKNYLLDKFLAQSPPTDLVVANGDYTVDTGFVGVSDEAAFESVEICLAKLRDKFGNKLHAIFGDHELGKFSMVGQHGGLRVASFHRAKNQLGLKPFWKIELENFSLVGVTSSLIALPVYEPETLPDERPAWRELRDAHLAEIRDAFHHIPPQQRIILFCHDPTALPFLAEEKAVVEKLGQMDHTVIGHLHSPALLWKSKLLAGMPVINFCGGTVRRLSRALRAARSWKQFLPKLCPSLAGIELFKDGGFLLIHLSDNGQPSSIELKKLPR